MQPQMPLFCSSLYRSQGTPLGALPGAYSGAPTIEPLSTSSNAHFALSYALPGAPKSIV